MKSRTKRSVALAAMLTLALASVAMSSSKLERTGKRFTVEGRVLQLNKADRTLLVSDMWSKKLYLVKVPEGYSVHITFGIYAQNAAPEFWQVHQNDRVRLRCIRSGEHLARLNDGSEATLVSLIR
jgi:hypothetical protein